ncbi:MAG TPA: hypothetical protein VF290_02645 [Pyrinomonadaceae bacterium]
MVEQFNALTEVEQRVFLDLVDPQPEPESAAKKTRKKRTTKSAKAQSLSTAIRSSHEAKGDAPTSDGQLCTAKIPGLDVVCGETSDKLIHDPNGGYAGYHPFDTSAQPAEKRSRRKAAGANITPNSEIEKGAAIGAGS